MSDPRDELLRQMRRLRASLDPNVVRRLEFAKKGEVPYDRDTAREAVRRFLTDRQDGGQYRSERLEGLKRK